MAELQISLDKWAAEYARISATRDEEMLMPEDGWFTRTELRQYLRRGSDVVNGMIDRLTAERRLRTEKSFRIKCNKRRQVVTVYFLEDIKADAPADDDT